MKRRETHKNGFTLVEMIVSLGLFTIVLFAISSAFLTMVSADRKSRATRITLDNLNLALEDMSRRIKTGYAYDCGAVGVPTDCATGNTTLKFKDQFGIDTTYKLTPDLQGIERTQGVSSAIRMTAPEIKIDNLKFIVKGTAKTGTGDAIQPYVTILIKGTTNVGLTSSVFNMETTVTQRKYDF
ncbi:MAG: type II secretion system protein [Patescibacteria group bacterium]